MADGQGDLGYYALPVLISFEGVDKQVNDGVGKSLGRLGDLGKRSGTALGKGIGDGLKTTQAEVNQATAAYEKLRDKAADALDKITVEEKKLANARAGGKEDQIAAAEARLAKARRDSTRASKEAEASHSSLLDKQKLLGSASTDLSGKLGGLTGIVGRLGPAVASLGVLAAGAAAGGIALLGAGAVTATRQLYELGAQGDDISDTLRIKTGATGGALDSLTESVQKIGRMVPMAYGQIGDVAAEVARNLHLTGPELEEMTANVANLGRMTGEAVNVRDLGKAFRGFGVDAKGQVPALDSLFNASQKSGIGVNELIANVVKGGPALRQLGLGFGESAALAAQLEEAGLDGTKMLGGLSKSLATMADKGLAGSDSFQQLVGKIKGFVASGNDAAALDMTNKLFGAKAGAQFFEAIKNGSLDLDSLASSMTGTGETIAQAAEGTADWSERWQLLKNEASDALKPLGDTVFNFVNDKLGALADWVSTHHNEIIDGFVTIGEVTISAGQDVLKSAGQMVEALGQLVGGVGNVVGAFYKMRAWSVVDDKLEAELNAQADAAFGWGEDIEAAGQKMVEFAGKGDDLKSELRKLADQSKDSKTDTVLFGGAAETAGGQAQTAAGQVIDLHDAMNKPLFGGAGFVGQFNDALANSPLFGAAGSGSVTTGSFPWDAVAQAESSGDWSNDNTGGHTTSSGAPRGGLQITDGTWKAFGGEAFAPTANLASKDQQVEVANRIAFNGWQGIQPQGLGAWEAITKGMVPGVTVDSKPTAAQTNSLQLAAGIGDRVPYGLRAGTDTGGYGSSGSVFPGWVHALEGAFGVKASTYAGHQEGDDLNKGIDWSGPVDAMQRFAEYLATIPGAMEQVIWDNPITGQKIGVADGQFVGPGTSQPGYYRDDWADHQNHVHTRQSLSIPLPGGSSLGLGALGQTGVSSSGIDLSRNTPDARLVSAFGGDYKPGIGTPGFDEEGNPGYYRVDPRQLAQAQRRVDDSQQAIADADQRILDAKQKRADLEEKRADLEEEAVVTAEDRAKADREVAKAERDADRARQDAAWAQEDAAETAKGKFTAAKKADQKNKTGKGGGFDDLGGIAGSFLKETFGLDGSLFPDISDLPAVKSLGAALGFAKGPLEQAAQGKLGIQQPGWSPGDPLPDIGVEGGGGGGGGLPLGMIPSVSSLLPSDPTAPGSNIHGAGGGGQPGPVDQSTHVTVNANDESASSIARTALHAVRNPPRINTYSAPAQVGGG